MIFGVLTAAVTSLAGAIAAPCGPANGNTMVNWAPAPTPALVAAMCPPCASTKAFVMAKPMPAPPSRRLRAASTR